MFQNIFRLSGMTGLATMVFSASVQSAEITQEIYCMQQTPERENGYIFQGVVYSKNGREHRLKISELGIGLLTSQGDGTVDEVLYEGDEYINSDTELTARSPQWRDAIPFLLPYEQRGNQFILYIEKNGFQPARNNQERFKARMKVTSQIGRETNFIFMCNAI